MNSELGRRIAFTLGALLVYRIGSYIPLPGIDVSVWAQIFRTYSDGILGLFNMASGGGVHRLAIFALGILPYVTAAILIQFAAIAWPRLRALSAAGDRGRDKIVAFTLYLTIVLTAFQAYGIALGLEGLHGVVPQPGLLFELTTVLTLTAGTMLLVWLCNQITVRGIGNGLALLLAAGFVVELPPAIAVAFERGRQGDISVDIIVVSLILAVVVTAFIAFVEGARRAIAVDFPRQTIGGKTLESRSTQLTLKINSAGLIPTVLAGWLIVILAFGAIAVAGADSAEQLTHGHPLFMILFSVLIILLTLFYTAFLIDPEKASEQLKAFGGVVRGVMPGEPTAAYLDSVISRVTLVGAVYLVLVFVVPEILIVYYGLPFYLGGVAFLIVVCAVLDIGAQLKQMQLTSRGFRT